MVSYSQPSVDDDSQVGRLGCGRCFSALLGISSGPGAFLGGRHLIIFLTCEGEKKIGSSSRSSGTASTSFIEAFTWRACCVSSMGFGVNCFSKLVGLGRLAKISALSLAW